EHGLEGFGRRHHALEAELDEVEERLRQRRPNTALKARGEATVGPFQRKPEGERERAAGKEQRGDQNGERVRHGSLTPSRLRRARARTAHGAESLQASRTAARSPPGSPRGRCR